MEMGVRRILLLKVGSGKAESQALFKPLRPTQAVPSVSKQSRPQSRMVCRLLMMWQQWWRSLK